MDMQLLSQVWTFIMGFAQLSLTGKISGIVLLLIAAWKSSMFQPYWAKLGKYQTIVAPILGVTLALISVQPLTWTAVWQSLCGGALAIALHQLLAMIKEMQGIGPAYQSFINFVENLLLAPTSPKGSARILMKMARKNAAKDAALNQPK